MKKLFRRGAASFYIVAFTTLILLVISLSFATVVISLTERTSDNDLSQSAYDSAMAGLEDAQLLILEYQKCLAGTRTVGCAEIRKAVEGGDDTKDCSAMPMALGRTYDSSVGTLIQESNTNGENQMQQSYTCVKISSDLSDVQGRMTRFGQNEVIKVSLTSPELVQRINKVQIEWGMDGQKTNNSYLTNTSDSGLVAVFPNSTNIVPAAISLAVVQAGDNFNIDDFKVVKNGQTNLGMVFLVPTAEKKTSDNFIASWNAANENVIDQNAFLKSNNKSLQNKPYAVYCQNGKCSTTIGLPEPIGGTRSKDNFLFVLSYYGNSLMDGMDYSLKLCHDSCEGISNGTTQGVVGQNSQIRVDSTGRANDMYRRVVARFEYGSDSSFLNILGPLELFSNGTSRRSLDKTFSTICEYDFNPTC